MRRWIINEDKKKLWKRGQGFRRAEVSLAYKDFYNWSPFPDMRTNQWSVCKSLRTQNFAFVVTFNDFRCWVSYNCLPLRTHKVGFVISFYS